MERDGCLDTTGTLGVRDEECQGSKPLETHSLGGERPVQTVKLPGAFLDERTFLPIGERIEGRGVQAGNFQLMPLPHHEALKQANAGAQVSLGIEFGHKD